MMKRKILKKYKGKCIMCKKPMLIIERESSNAWCKKHDIRVANFYCSNKCNEEFKKILNNSIYFAEGFNKAKKEFIKKLKEEIKQVESHMKEIRHWPDNRYHRGSIDILEIIINWTRKRLDKDIEEKQRRNFNFSHLSKKI